MLGGPKSQRPSNWPTGVENEAQEPRTPPRARLSSIIAPITALGFPSAIAGYLPSRHWIVDLPACFPVQAGAALLLGATVLFAARRKWLGLIWLLGALAAAWAVVPGWVIASGVRPGNGPVLTVLSMNLARGNEPNVARALAIIHEAKPDVVFLSELTPSWQRALRPALAEFPHRHLHPDPGYFGLGLLSKRPLRGAVTIPLGYSWAPAITATIVTPDGPIGLLGIHTPRPGRGDRCVERDAALAAVPAALTGLPARRVVIGDFNATPWTQSFRELVETTSLHHASGDNFRPTWPMQYPWPFRIPIDHVLTGGSITADRVEIGESFGSDHAPLLVQLRL